ncbi:unnamed protein product [Dibothriocephalus latus]|uniref:Uncharacterized protein n=1 Tax=Dibothriocephalus latus TaxID=60516 RepID=A0A3P6QG98_DIBLA|nr:unnamed protein product [Dibothriocephalus latus]
MKVSNFTRTKQRLNIYPGSFSRFFTREAKLTVTNFSTEEIPTIDSAELTGVTLLQELLKLQDMKSPGPDGIHIKLLKEIAVELTEPL